MSVFVYINVHILKGAEWTRPMGKKVIVTNIFIRRIFCDCKFEKRGKTCFKTAGANGVLDIYWDITKSSSFATFLGNE
jgi:hypothetical protein